MIGSVPSAAGCASAEAPGAGVGEVEVGRDCDSLRFFSSLSLRLACHTSTSSTALPLRVRFSTRSDLHRIIASQHSCFSIIASLTPPPSPSPSRCPSLPSAPPPTSPPPIPSSYCTMRWARRRMTDRWAKPTALSASQWEGRWRERVSRLGRWAERAKRSALVRGRKGRRRVRRWWRVRRGARWGEGVEGGGRGMGWRALRGGG